MLSSLMCAVSNFLHVAAHFLLVVMLNRLDVSFFGSLVMCLWLLLTPPTLKACLLLDGLSGRMYSSEMSGLAGGVMRSIWMWEGSGVEGHLGLMLWSAQNLTEGEVGASGLK